jgi:glycosyltransferase involved in cell wall biosynthesis
MAQADLLLNDSPEFGTDAIDSVPVCRPTQTLPVLHVINGEHYAGAERVQDLLAKQLPYFGFHADFVCLKPGQFAMHRAARTSQVFDLPMQGRFDLRPAWKLAALVREHNYRLIHSHTARSALIAAVASKLTGVPMVHHVHSPASADTTHWLKNRLNAFTERVVLGRAQALVAVSESLGRHVRQLGFRSERIFVVHNGVPARPEVPPRNPEKNDWTLGIIALFRPRKGLEILLQALAVLRGQNHAVRLLAVGSFETPEYESIIRAEVSRLNLNDAIEWRGFARDIDPELAQMDLFILPSLFGEGLPMVVLEAMSAGLPVVASAVQGVPEAIRAGIDGLLVEPGDAQGLAEAIGLVLSGEYDWNALRGSAMRRHAERFSDARMAGGVASVYGKVIAATRWASMLPSEPAR